MLERFHAIGGLKGLPCASAVDPGSRVYLSVRLCTAVSRGIAEVDCCSNGRLRKMSHDSPAFPKCTGMHSKWRGSLPFCGPVSVGAASRAHNKWRWERRHFAAPVTHHSATLSIQPRFAQPHTKQRSHKFFFSAGAFAFFIPLARATPSLAPRTDTAGGHLSSQSRVGRGTTCCRTHKTEVCQVPDTSLAPLTGTSGVGTSPLNCVCLG